MAKIDLITSSSESIARDISGFAVRVFTHPAIKIIISVSIIVLTMYVLHDLSVKVSWSDVKKDISNSSWLSIGFAILATVISFAALSFYDVFAVRTVAKDQVPNKVAAFAGSAGTAVSNLIGFSYLTGTAVRYRIYASLGVDLSRVANIIAIAWIGFWLGLMLILGLLMLAHPNGLSDILPLNEQTEIVIGSLIILAMSGLFIWLACAPRSMTMGGFRVALPGLKLTLALTGVAVIDLSGAAMTLYFLTPSDLSQNLLFFFVIYMAAIALGILSHSPGGLGVFEATVIAGLGAAGRSDMLAALLLYRMIYFVLPFFVSVTALTLGFVLNRRRTVLELSGATYLLIRPLVPMAVAGITLLAGIILIISGTLPSSSSRLGLLRDIVPMPIIEISHLLGSIVGILLIVIARGLYRKLSRAWVAAMFLMVLGLAASLLKGLDWEEAVGMGLAITLLIIFRSAFYRTDSVSVFRLDTKWLFTCAALLAAIFWVGLFAYSNVEYQDTLWWQFAFDADVSRSLRASFVISVIFLGIGLHSILNKRGAIKQNQVISNTVRDIIAQSPSTEAQLDLLGDKSFLVSEDNIAYLAYCDTGGSLITRGEPIGDETSGKNLMWQLRELADRSGKRCAFYAVSSKYMETYLDLGLSILKIGETARVSLKGFTLDGPKKKSFRYAHNKAARDGYEFSVVKKADVPKILPELRNISDAWMKSKQGEEKAFSLGYFDETYLVNFDHAVLRHSDTGGIVAFANLFQGANQHELSLDLMRYDPTGPKIAMDALFGAMMLWGAEQGFQWFSLGAAPFSGIENRELSSLWNRIGGFIYNHGENVYHFEGLRSFKQKFDPTWTPNYLASPGGLAAPKILYEVNSLVSGGVRGLLR